MPTILLVEDDAALSELIASYLERNGYQVSVIAVAIKSVTEQVTLRIWSFLI